MIIARRNLMSGGAKMPTARDYVQNGLLFNFNGVENVGLGLPHDQNARIWKNLTDRSVSQVGNISFGNDYAVFSGNCTIDTGVRWNNDFCTVEAGFAYDDSSSDSCVLACTATGGFSIQYEGGKKFFAARDNSTNSYKFSYRNWPILGFVSETYIVKAGAIETYENGILVDELSGFSRIKPPTANTLHIGSASSGLSQFFKGRMRYVRIYDRALTADEVVKNFAVDKAIFNLG